MSSKVGASNNHKNNNKKAQIKTKSKSSAKQLTHEEIDDLDNTIEHLIAVGTQIQNQINRRKLYFEEINDTGSEEGEEENKAASAATLSLLEQEETATTKQTKKKKAKKQQKDSKSKLLFTEDIRLYGNRNKSKMKQMEISPSYPCFEKNPWPQQPNSNNNQKSNTKRMTKYNLSMMNSNQNDKAWDIEYGDTIHPIAFSNSRLSSFINVNHQQKQIIDGKNLSIGTTDISISQHNDIPRALLLRCWENAVHASSSTIYAPIIATSSHNHHPEQKNETSSSSSVVVAVEAAAAAAAVASPEKQHKQQNLDDDDDDHNTSSRTQIGMKRKRQQQQHQSSSSLYHNAIDSISKQGEGYRPRTVIEAKCKSLGIRLEDFKTNKKHKLLECPRCKSNGFDDDTKFADSALALQQHYYGSSKFQKDQTRIANGCCWSWLYEKQSNLVDRLLQNHIETQTELLLGLLFDQAAAKKKKKASTTKRDDDDEEENKMDDDNESTAKMKRRATTPPTTMKETAAKKSGGDAQEDTETKGKKKRLFNWKDVIDMFDDAINNSSSTLSSNPSSSGRHPPLPRHHHHHPILETIQTTTTNSNNNSKKKKQEEAGISSSAAATATLSPPLLLNPMILESAKKALIERYGPNRIE